MYNTKAPIKGALYFGEPVGIRTLDTRLRRPLLYPAELRAHDYLKNGAEDEIRTRDPRLGKAMLYP